MLKFRLYLDKDEEEIWLNEMCQRGWALKKFFLGFCSFEACNPNEYNYQIDLLDNWSGNREEYTSFMNELGVEVISQWYRWVYVRKKTVDGPLEMYTDAASKIGLYKRIKNFFLLGFIIEVVCFLMEIYGAATIGSTVYLGFIIILGIFSFVFLRMVLRLKLKIERLKNGIK